MKATALFTWLALGLALVAGFDSAVHAADLKKLKKDIRKRVEADDIDGAIALVREIGSSGDPKTVETLYDVGRKYGVTRKLFEETAKEFARQQGAIEWLTEKYKKLKGKGDFRERVYIATLATGIESEAGRGFLASILEDKSDFVVREAVRGLEKTMHRDAVEPLILLLERLSRKRRDVLYHEVRDALYNLTGEDFDLVDDWKAWWEPLAGTFDPKKRDDRGPTSVRKRKRGGDPEFFGVPVTSKNILFIIDTSGSMKYVMKTDIPGLARADGSDSGQGSGGGQMTAEDQRLAKFWTRMEMAKRELRKVVMQMDKAAKFNMLNFDSGVYLFNKKGSLNATPRSKKKAYKWIDSLRQKGNTDTGRALKKGFSADAKTNTIFLLSDGLPSKDGKVEDPHEPILEHVFRMNRFRKIKIYTFGFYHRVYPSGQPDESLKKANDFLRRLAESTGGKFTPMKVDTRFTPDNPYGPEGPGGKGKGGGAKKDEVTAPSLRTR